MAERTHDRELTDADLEDLLQEVLEDVRQGRVVRCETEEDLRDLLQRLRDGS